MSRLRFAEIGEQDLPDVLAISLSHPEFLDLTEGSAGEHGHYDLEMLQRDWWLGTLEPGRSQMVGRLEDGAAAVRLDLLERNPRDGFPWIGLLMVHRDHGRQGLGREGAAAAVERLGGPPVRLGVLDGNAPAFAFWRALGGREIEPGRPRRAGRDGASGTLRPVSSGRWPANDRSWWAASRSGAALRSRCSR